MSNYKYITTELNEDILSKVKDEIEKIDNLIEYSSRYGITSEHIAFIKYFQQVFRTIDPNGNEESGTIYSDWYEAGLYNGREPQTAKEKREVFYQQTGIIKSLLFGKIKIVYYEEENIVPALSDPGTAEKDYVYILSAAKRTLPDYIWKNNIETYVETLSDNKLICKGLPNKNNEIINDAIFRNIVGAKKIIADITELTEDVMAALGIALIYDKDILYFYEKNTKIPDTINSKFKTDNECCYTTDAEGIVKIEEKITQFIKKN